MLIEKTSKKLKKVDKYRKQLKIHCVSNKVFLQAEVAELADALRSGRSGCTPMRVQIPPPAFMLPGLSGEFLFHLA
jgi:hypothetical protein